MKLSGQRGTKLSKVTCCDTHRNASNKLAGQCMLPTPRPRSVQYEDDSTCPAIGRSPTLTPQHPREPLAHHKSDSATRLSRCRHVKTGLGAVGKRKRTI